MKIFLCVIFCLGSLHAISPAQIVFDDNGNKKTEEKSSPMEPLSIGDFQEHWIVTLPKGSTSTISKAGHNSHSGIVYTTTISDKPATLKIAFLNQESNEENAQTIRGLRLKFSEEDRDLISVAIERLLEEQDYWPKVYAKILPVAITEAVRSGSKANQFNHNGTPYLSSALALISDAKLQDKKFHPNLLVYTDLLSQNSEYKNEIFRDNEPNDFKGFPDRVLVPSKAENDLKQLIVANHEINFIDSEFIAADTFDQARKFSIINEKNDISQASALFKEVQGVLRDKPNSSMIRNKYVRAKLKEVYTLNPNHLSAKLLLISGSDARPKTYEPPYLTYLLLDYLKPLEKLLKNPSLSSNERLIQPEILSSLEEIDAISSLVGIKDKQYLLQTEEVLKNSMRIFVKQAFNTSYYDATRDGYYTDTRDDVKSMRARRKEKYINESNEQLTQLKLKLESSIE
ncbi:hypothetical protein [Rubritalea sp.]|uniref:hypothetical protein n=1 Tax=Rubritalea sp. TaxID=2109375 RepID=UPI003EF43AC2